MAEHKDRLKGGLADKRCPEDFSKNQIRKGTKIEHEHTDNPLIAREIAMDHCEEIPCYYDRLEKMEKEAEKEGATRGIREELAFEAKLGLAFGLITESYCPACGGVDIAQGGKGHRAGCPLGETGSSIKGTREAIAPYAKELFKIINEALSFINPMAEAAGSGEPVHEMTDGGMRLLDRTQAHITFLHEFSEAKRIPGLSIIGEEMPEVIYDIYEHSRQGDYRATQRSLESLKDVLERIRRAVQIIMEI
jgi:hypothetical protein